LVFLIHTESLLCQHSFCDAIYKAVTVSMYTF